MQSMMIRSAPTTTGAAVAPRLSGPGSGRPTSLNVECKVSVPGSSGGPADGNANGRSKRSVKGVGRARGPAAFPLKGGRASKPPSAPEATSSHLRPSDLLEDVAAPRPMSAASASTPPSGLRPSDLLDEGGDVVSHSGATIDVIESPAPRRGRGSWEELLGQAERETALTQRARSASDANSLRRKGHLKEQDMFIQFILSMFQTHTCEEVMQKMDMWIKEHRKAPEKSKLRQLVPSIGHFFTELNLMPAFREYDEFFALSRRKHIGPNFAEIRHILNIAQVHGAADNLKLITFDADGTLYADGHHFDTDNAMIDHIITLMRNGIEVAIVTAAGYPGQPEKFEMRVQGLLDEFKHLQLPPSITKRFHILGGECNYLVRVVPDTYRLEMVPDEEWKSEEMMQWSEDDIQALLDNAEALIREGASRLRMPVKILRKERAVGCIPVAPTIYEVLEDLAITVQINLRGNKVPYCAFNGGNDVFVDVGNKNHGLLALQSYFGAQPSEVVHVGDRFTDSGNDRATRDCCSILWVANPEETAFFMKVLIKDLMSSINQRYVE